MTYDTLPVPIPVSPADSDILTFSDSPSWSPASFASSALPITPQTKDEARLAAPPPFSPRRTPGSSHFHYSGAIAGDARYHYNRALEALTKDRPPAQKKEDYSSRFKEELNPFDVYMLNVDRKELERKLKAEGSSQSIANTTKENGFSSGSPVRKQAGSGSASGLGLGSGSDEMLVSVSEMEDGSSMDHSSEMNIQPKLLSWTGARQNEDTMSTYSTTTGESVHSGHQLKSILKNRAEKNGVMEEKKQEVKKSRSPGEFWMSLNQLERIQWAETARIAGQVLPTPQRETLPFFNFFPEPGAPTPPLTLAPRLETVSESTETTEMMEMMDSMEIISEIGRQVMTQGNRPKPWPLVKQAGSQGSVNEAREGRTVSEDMVFTAGLRVQRTRANRPPRCLA